MMMVEEINKSVKQNRNWAVLGIGVGLALILGYFGYQYAVSVDRPSIPDSRPKVIVAYISNPHGLRRLAQIEQRQFLEEWREYLMSDDKAKEDLGRHLNELDPPDRKAFVNEMLFQFKELVVDDARRYGNLTNAERNKFVSERAEELSGQDKFVRQIGSSLGSEVGGQEWLRQWVFDNTTPKERELCMPYLDAIQRAAKELEKRRSADASATASAG